jgi:hypothetical protein
LAGDIETLEAKVTEAAGAGLTALARKAAASGEQVRTVLSQLAMSRDSECRQFAFQALQFLAESNLDQEQAVQAESIVTDSDVQAGGGQSVGAIIDATALESLLSAPDSLPASLAASFGCSPAVQACLLELIVRD